MKRTIVKAVSLVLASSFLLATASCAKKDKTKKAKTISEDTPWFEYTVIDAETGADPNKAIEYLYPEFAGSDDKYYVIYTQGRYRTPPENEIDYSTFDYNSYNFNYVAVIDRNTKKVVNHIDLNSGLDKEMLTYEHVDTANYIDGKVMVKTNRKIRDYDPLTGKVLDERPSLSNDFAPTSRFYKIGEYLLETEQIWDDYGRTTATLKVTAPDGNVTSYDFKDAGENPYLYTILTLNDTKALIPVSTAKGYKYYELDLSAGKLLSGKEKDYKWLDMGYLGEITTGTDGQIYSYTSGCISRIDAAKKSVEEVFNFEWCGMNWGLMNNNFKLIECSGDKLTFAGQTKIRSQYESASTNFQIVEFSRADKNPNAGKTILELYSDNVDEVIGAAIQKFNEQSSKYYIVLADTYDSNDFVDDSAYNDIDNDDDWNKIKIEAAAGESNALAMDIINGEGPDILLNTDSFSRLNKSSYLVDLSPYVKDFGPDDYFTNIIEGARTNGVIYQLPVSFAINGISTDKKYAGASGVGFTLDEYKAFVKNDLNGFDPMMTGQAVYFTQLFNSMSEKFISDGKADFTGPEFKELAEYVKDNVPEKAMTWDDINDVEDEARSRAETWPIRGIGMFYMAAHSSAKNATVLGTPSLDGRGPMYYCNFSVAISANSVDPDACGEFVKILLSDEIQTGIAMNDYFVINRKAFRSAGTAANNYYNNGGQEAAGGSGVFVATKLTAEDIDNIERVILSCSKMDCQDSDISIILIEEMPAYFLGQKSLDDVIKIAQNRAQKVLDERGK